MFILLFLRSEASDFMARLLFHNTLPFFAVWRLRFDFTFSKLGLYILSEGLKAGQEGRRSKTFRARGPSSFCFIPTPKTEMSFCILHHCVERQYLDARQRKLPLSIWNSLTKLQKHLGVWKTDCLVLVYVVKSPKWEIADERKIYSWWPLCVFLLIKNLAFNFRRGANRFLHLHASTPL